MHNCSDFLTNIYSVVNDVQNVTELVVVQSTMRKRFSLSWDNDPGYEMNVKKADSATAEENTRL